MTNEEAIAWFEKAVPKNCLECPKEHDYSCSYANSLRCEAYMLARIALREQKERKHGEWVSEPCEHFDMTAHHHKECGHRYIAYTKHGHNFCPNCGADMRGRANVSN